jgi:proton-coupled amino acid transporter
MTVAMTGIAWVRDITKFSFAFLVGVLCLAFTWFTVMFFTVKQLKEQGGISPNIEPIGRNYPIMISFSIYSFEGIGIVMPIMQTTAVPERFGTILIAAISTLIGLYLIFSMTTYLTFGDQTGQFITDNLPQDNILCMIIKLAIVLNLICSYPIVINPCNTILEGAVVSMIN